MRGNTTMDTIDTMDTMDAWQHHNGYNRYNGYYGCMAAPQWILWIQWILWMHGSTHTNHTHAPLLASPVTAHAINNIADPTCCPAAGHLLPPHRHDVGPVRERLQSTQVRDGASQRASKRAGSLAVSVTKVQT
jgi:hypothetical protein